MAILEGSAYWAAVTTPNTTFEPTYSVNLVVDEATAADFKARGFNIKQMEEGPSILIKRKVEGPNGMVRQAPKLIDQFKKPLDARVGNGSTVKVQYNEWETTNKYGSFKGLDFQAMQVLNLVEVGTPDGEELGMTTEEYTMEDEL
jgi:hypothetical protein|tara:strand:- start:1846 stop:2280 length:435 start_codon:yes stop_codon:yes gene_type:complete